MARGNPREPAHSRRTGHVPGVSVTVKTAKAPHEQPVGRPTPPHAQDLTQFNDLNQPDLPPVAKAAVGASDLSDFQPTFKGGAGVGTSAFNTSDASNLVYDGGFEEGIGAWISSPPTVLTIATAHVTEGTQALRGANSAATSPIINFLSPQWAIPDGTTFLQFNADMFYSKVSTNAFHRLIISFYDSGGSFISGAHTRSIGAIPSTFMTLELMVTVPSGATFFSINPQTISHTAFFTTSEATVLDNVIVFPPPFIEGVFDGTVTPQTELGEADDYTPTAVQGGDLAVIVNIARWVRIGHKMMVYFDLTTGAAGTSGSQVVIGLPTATDSPNGSQPVALTLQAVGFAHINGFGSGNYAGVTARLSSVSSSPTLTFLRADINTVGGAMGVDPLSTIGVGALIQCTVEYEVF